MAAASGGLERIVLTRKWPKDAPIGDRGDVIEVDTARAEALLGAGIAEIPSPPDETAGGEEDGGGKRKPRTRRRK